MATKKLFSIKKATFLEYYIPIICIFFGLICIGIYSYWRLSSLYLSFESYSAPAVISTSDYSPLKEIIIPSIKINLDVAESKIKNSIWEVSDTGVSHLEGSATPGQPGTIIMYGHNKSDVLGPIINLKNGDIIQLKSINGEVYSYKVDYTLTVTPKDIWVLKSSTRERLVLYTCTGFFDLKRFVVFADPI